MAYERRLRRETEIWGERYERGDTVIEPPERERAKEGGVVVTVGAHTMYCSVQYPFRPPKWRSFRPVSAVGGLDVQAWCWTVLCYPELKRRFPNPERVRCLCCESLTCDARWSVHCMLLDVAREALFSDAYVKCLQLPTLLPDDLMRHVVDAQSE